MKKFLLTVVSFALFASVSFLSCTTPLSEVSIKGGAVSITPTEHPAPAVVKVDKGSTYVQVAWPFVSNTVEYRLYIKDCLGNIAYISPISLNWSGIYSNYLCVDVENSGLYSILLVREGLFYGDKDIINVGAYMARGVKKAEVHEIIENYLDRFLTLPALSKTELTNNEKFGLKLRKLRTDKGVWGAFKSYWYCTWNYKNT